MGYSLAPAPDAEVPSLPRSSRVVTPSFSREKLFQAREELTPIPSRTGEEVTEIVSFLNSVEPPKPPESHLYSTNSKLKKSTLGSLWKLGRSSSKRQEKLRAALPKRTRDEESITGAKYLHIAVDQSAFKSSANLSIYRANDYRDPAQKRTTVSPTIPSETSAAAEKDVPSVETPSIPKSQSFQLSDALGISREFPHLIAGEAKTKAARRIGKDGKPIVSSSDTLVPRHVNDNPKPKDFAIHSSNVRFELIPAEPPRGCEFVSSTGSANSSVLDLTAVHPRTSNKNLRRTSNRQTGPIAIEVVTESVQLPPSSARSSRSPRLPSRQSVQSVSDGLATPIPRNSQSTRSSTQSAGESVAEDVLTDASSGIVLNAQSAEYMRPQDIPGHPGSTAMRKPPKPGPAPTRALPSLPEGQDGITMIHRPPVDPRSPTLRIEQSPERPLPMQFPSPPKSPPKDQRHSHPDLAETNEVKVTTALVKSATVPQPHWPLSSNPPFSLPANTSSTQPQPQSQSRASLSTLPMNPETLAAWRRRRISTTKALKRRDLDRGRVRHTSHKSLDIITVVDTSDDRDIGITDSKHTDTPREESHSSADEDDKAPPRTMTSFRRQEPHHRRHTTAVVSPIMLVAAQSPDATPKRTSWLAADAYQASTAAHTNTSPEPERRTKNTFAGSLPSSGDDDDDEEGPQPSQSRSSSPSPTPSHHQQGAHAQQQPQQQQRHKRPQTPMDPNRAVVGARAAKNLERGGKNGAGMEELEERMERRLEERMERRLEVMERKNQLLEAALLAVISASAGFVGGGERSGGAGGGAGARGRRSLGAGAGAGGFGGGFGGGDGFGGGYEGGGVMRDSGVVEGRRSGGGGVGGRSGGRVSEGFEGKLEALVSGMRGV